MYKFQRLSPEHIQNIISWNEGMDETFLVQWTAGTYRYPITAEQMEKRLKEGARIYEILLHEEIIGTIELISVEEETGEGYIGRYLLNPALAGQGHGTGILKEFTELCFGVPTVKAIKICVYDFNKGARRCYEKVGFQVKEEDVRQGFRVYDMKLFKSSLTLSRSINSG